MKPRAFCPFCGKASEPLPGSRHRRCPACGEHDWLNPAPAVGIALLRGGQVLLSKRARQPKQGEWDLVGGFVDEGETPDDAIRREVEEETGCKATGLRMHGSAAPGDYDGQPTLNFLYTGEVVGEPVAHDDSAELRWWPLAEVPAIAWSHEAAFVRSLAAAGRRR